MIINSNITLYLIETYLFIYFFQICKILFFSHSLSYYFIRAADSHMNMKQAQYECQEFEDSLMIQQNQRLRDLKAALYYNKRNQNELKSIRDMIKKRMSIIEEYISSYKIKSEYPTSTALLSYIKFQRNIPTSFREMAQISYIDSTFSKKQEEQCEFMNKLIHSKPPKKKKEVHLKDLPQNPKADDFTELSKDSQFKNGLQIYRVWLESKKVRGPKKLFTMAQDNLITERHTRYGENWEKICSHVQGRSFDQIYYEYHNRINPNLIGGRWNIRQTLMLLVLVQHFGSKRWILISKKIKIKSQQQVRERYSTLLDPSLTKDIWTYQLQKTLLEVAEQYGFCWKKISQLSFFKDKSDNSIWRRYRTLMMRFSEEEIRNMLPPNSNNRNLAEKIIRQKRIYEGRKRASMNKPQPPIYFKHYQPQSTFSSKSITPIQKNYSENLQILNEQRHQIEARINHQRDSQFYHKSGQSHNEIFQESEQQDL